MRRSPRATTRSSATCALGGAVIAVIFSAYLTYLELHVIEAICQWCVGSAVVAALLLVVHGAWAYRDV